MLHLDHRILGKAFIADGQGQRTAMAPSAAAMESGSEEAGQEFGVQIPNPRAFELCLVHGVSHDGAKIGGHGLL